MTETDPLPPIPLRPVATALPQEWIDEIDILRRCHPDLPSRAMMIRYSVAQTLRVANLSEEQQITVEQAIIAFEEDRVAGEIGEPQGTA